MTEMSAATPDHVVKKLLSDSAKTLGICGAQKMFNMSAHGTAYVSCGLRPDHRNKLHETVRRYEDGSSITYRWTV
jgi:hypothetical protein